MHPPNYTYARKKYLIVAILSAPKCVGVMLYKVLYNKHPLAHLGALGIKNPRRYYTYFQVVAANNTVTTSVEVGNEISDYGIKYDEMVQISYDTLNTPCEEFRTKYHKIFILLKSFLSFEPSNRIDSVLASNILRNC